MEVMKNWMKGFMLKYGGTIASFALVVTALNVNSACMFAGHQPKLPEGSEKLRKF